MGVILLNINGTRPLSITSKVRQQEWIT